MSKVPESSPSSDLLEGYEKLRVVGKGAFGIAVLYRKTEDETLRVIKEINMNELKAGERQLALNEVHVLKILDHPNVISYYRNFEKNGSLYIEMEYADGGTLAQYLSNQYRPLKEIDVLVMFQQIVSAIKYMHDHNVLHRDLKTANVFLTKDKTIKVGDFGISKVMATASQARSVLGTPYYISPEMCEGKEYDQKSDVWALGCVLYEITCLKKAFDGPNLPAVVKKIMRGKFEPVPCEYSEGLRLLVCDLLQKDPQLRPSAADVHDRLSKLVNDFLTLENELPDNLNALQRSFSKSGRTERSVLYELICSGMFTSLNPVPLPPKIQIREIAVSNTHFIALTTDLIVYTWGGGGKGQLGQGDTVFWSGTPTPVHTLKDKNVKMVAAGDGFSVFGSESGMVMTCGDGTYGCLGHGDYNDVTYPKVIEKLLTADITEVSCGDQHVFALSREGVTYSWGKGRGGRLGLGHEENSCSPSVVPLPKQIVLRNVKCGGDATMAITANGALYACGNNIYNKLGLSDRKNKLWFQVQQAVAKSLTLKRVTSISGKISDVSLGPHHTTILTERGQVMTMGRNFEGQKGIKSKKPSFSPSYVRPISDKIATMVKSGPFFSIVGTLENVIYFWGTRCKREDVGEILNSSGSSFLNQDYCSRCSGGAGEPVQYVQHHEIVSEPKEILALYASPKQIKKGETVNLSGIYVSQNSIFILVNTTAPLAKKKNSAKLLGQKEDEETLQV